MGGRLVAADGPALAGVTRVGWRERHDQHPVQLTHTFAGLLAETDENHVKAPGQCRRRPVGTLSGPGPKERPGTAQYGGKGAPAACNSSPTRSGIRTCH